MNTSRLLTLAVLLSLPAGANAQSLGEIAAKEKEKREQAQKSRDKNAPPVKVYTEDDLRKKGDKEGPAGSTSRPVAAPVPRSRESEEDVASGTRRPAAGRSAAGESGVDRAAEEASWRARAKACRAAVVAGETAIQSRQDEIGRLALQITQSTDTNEILRLKAQQQQAMARLEEAKQQLADAKKARDDFEDTARKAGVPPGWVDPDR